MPWSKITAHITESIDHLESTWKEMVAHRPFDFHFLDDEFDQLYRTETQAGQALGVFAGLAIIIASLGLFGLAAFTTVQRAKEIGIRKVLGASSFQLVSLLSRDFTKTGINCCGNSATIRMVCDGRLVDKFCNEG
ncbi:MAG: hypothetical protein R3B93_21945 [Bacteroidia bacterium]